LGRTLTVDADASPLPTTINGKYSHHPGLFGSVTQQDYNTTH